MYIGNAHRDHITQQHQRRLQANQIGGRDGSTYLSNSTVPPSTSVAASGHPLLLLPVGTNRVGAVPLTTAVIDQRSGSRIIEIGRLGAKTKQRHHPFVSIVDLPDKDRTVGLHHVHSGARCCYSRYMYMPPLGASITESVYLRYVTSNEVFQYIESKICYK